MQIKLSTNECTKICEYFQKNNPELITDALEQIKKPDADFNYLFLLLKVLNAFCKRKGFEPEYITGTGIGRQAIAERSLFIAVCLKLYSPWVFNKEVNYSIRNNVREEIAGMLEVNIPNWISQQVDGIKVSMRAYPEFRDQVNALVEYMIKEIKVKEVKYEYQTTLLQ